MSKAAIYYAFKDMKEDIALLAKQIAGMSSQGQCLEGFKLVPIKPTLTMIDEGNDASAWHVRDADDIYKAMLAAAPVAPVVAASDVLSDQDRVDAEWVNCESRAPWVRNNMQEEINTLRDKARKCKSAYKRDFMRIPCEYIASAYEAAANTLEVFAARANQEKAK